MKVHSIKKCMILLIMFVQLIVLTACSKRISKSDSIISEKEDSSSISVVSTQSEDEDNIKKLYGQVIKMDGNQITISIGTLRNSINGDSLTIAKNDNSSLEEQFKEISQAESLKEESLVDESSTQEGSTQENSVDESLTQENSTQESSVDESLTQENSTQESSVHESLTQENSIQESSTPSDPKSSDKDKSNEVSSILTFTGEEMVITITDESVISGRTDEGTVTGLSAIKEGDVIALTYVKDEKGEQTLSAVDIIMNMGKNLRVNSENKVGNNRTKSNQENKKDKNKEDKNKEDN